MMNPSFNTDKSHWPWLIWPNWLWCCCLPSELPMAVFERDTSCSNGVPRLRHSLVPRCDLNTAAGRFLTSMVSTFFLPHQHVVIELPDFDDALNHVKCSSNIVVWSSIGCSAENFRINNPNLLFPLNFQESAMQHSVEGVTKVCSFYARPLYTPPSHLIPFQLLNVFEWNCPEYSPFARDPNSFCRSLIAGKIGKRCISVYNIDPDQSHCKAFRALVNGHLLVIYLYIIYSIYEELWLNFSRHVRRMNHFGQCYLQSRSRFISPGAISFIFFATDLSTTSNGPDTDETLKRYRVSKATADKNYFSFLGDNTQCGDDDHVFYNFFAFFPRKKCPFCPSCSSPSRKLLFDDAIGLFGIRFLTGQNGCKQLLQYYFLIPCIWQRTAIGNTNRLVWEECGKLSSLISVWFGLVQRAIHLVRCCLLWSARHPILRRRASQVRWCLHCAASRLFCCRIIGFITNFQLDARFVCSGSFFMLANMVLFLCCPQWDVQGRTQRVQTDHWPSAAVGTCDMLYRALLPVIETILFCTNLPHWPDWLGLIFWAV